MYKLKKTAKFKKDFKRIKKRGYDLDLLYYVVNELVSGNTLDEKYYNHQLTGDYNGFMECHITPDWLLIYKIDNNELILTASRTGTHSDLF